MKILVNDGLRFVCDTEAELWRARTLLTKEPGTIKWLNAQLRAGDVFYDIGANVGCYTLYAARLVGETGHVYAFEPHPANAAALIRNIEANGFSKRVTVIAAPLGSSDGPTWLLIGSMQSGTSGTTTGFGSNGRIIVGLVVIDELIDLCLIMRPNVVKVDVDGNETSIVIGMAGALLHGNPPRSLQIESEPNARLDIERLMAVYGYRKVGHHYTKDCQARIDQGFDPARVIENAMFEKVFA